MVSCHSGGVWERNYYPTSNFLPSLSRLPACSRRRRRSRYSTCIAFLKRNFFNALIFFLSLKYNNNRMTMRVRLSSRRQNCMYHRRIRIFPRAKQKEKKFICSTACCRVEVATFLIIERRPRLWPSSSQIIITRHKNTIIETDTTSSTTITTTVAARTNTKQNMLTLEQINPHQKRRGKKKVWRETVWERSGTYSGIGRLSIDNWSIGDEMEKLRDE
jgi:hypothetical protein